MLGMSIGDGGSEKMVFGGKMRNLDFLVELWFLVSGGEIDDCWSVVAGSMIFGRWWQKASGGWGWGTRKNVLGRKMRNLDFL